jgi:hypothetical protein
MPPTLLKGDPVLQTSISLLRAAWQHKYADTYRILRSTPWPEPINIIAAKYDGKDESVGHKVGHLGTDFFD